MFTVLHPVVTSKSNVTQFFGNKRIGLGLLSPPRPIIINTMNAVYKVGEIVVGV